MKTTNVDKQTYDSVEFAKYIIAFCNSKQTSINMTKLQKLLYIAYGTWLVIKNERLVDEHPQAGPYGPVFPRIINKLSDENFNFTFDDVQDDIKGNSDCEAIMESIFEKFGKGTATQLSEWSHTIGSAGDITVCQLDFKGGRVIEDTDTKNGFNTIVNYKPQNG